MLIVEVTADRLELVDDTDGRLLLTRLPLE
jgi:hypothetical protein